MNTDTTVTISGDIRLYFNRHKDAPRVWCISDLDRTWEIQLAGVDVQARMATSYRPADVLEANHEGPPAATLVTLNKVTVVIKHGFATIKDDK